MPDSASDDALMAHVVEGDQQAFALLVERHLQRAYAIARRVLAEPADAEDATQEAFTRVWTHARDWQPQRGSFSSWFGRILINASLDHGRRLSARRLLSNAEALLDELPDGAPDLVVAQGQAETTTAVGQALQRLPARQRMAVVLCYFEDYSNPQAAQLMGLHVKALEGLLVRARKQLRGWLQRHREEA